MKWASFVFSTLPLLIQRYAERYQQQDNAATLDQLEEEHGVPRIKTYDYIIVGGGTAGSLLAARISEKFSVLLLEAGGTPVPMSQTPYYTEIVALDLATNYLFRSVPQRNAALRDEGVISIYNGKMLGGSSSHNEMIYFRGHPNDWNGYARKVRDDSYNFTNIIQHYKHSEHFVGKLLNSKEAESFGTDGPMTTDSEFTAACSPWFEAGRELGYPTLDPNTRQQRESFTPMHKWISKGQRVSTYNSYIKPVEGHRGNLTVIRYAYANEVLINDDKKAYGVAYTRHGIPQIAHASREVIISCGTFSSPLLLMRSGVGPTGTLNRAGIPVKVRSSRVGQNLVDHVYVFFDGFSLNSSAEPYVSRVPNENFEEMLDLYEKTGEGVLGGLNAGPQAVVASSRAKRAGESNWPDTRLTLFTRCTRPFDDNSKSPIYWCLIVTLDRPKSTGSITLNVTEYKSGSKDDTKLAIVDFNTFGDSSDVDVIVDGIELGLKVFEETKSFKKLGATYAKGPVPECSQYVYRSRAYWRCYVQTFTGPATHMTGTCSMGSVVDRDLRVKGAKNLRVVDASVFPFSPSANIAGPVIAIAEKIASDILTDK